MVPNVSCPQRSHFISASPYRPATRSGRSRRRASRHPRESADRRSGLRSAGERVDQGARERAKRAEHPPAPAPNGVESIFLSSHVYPPSPEKLRSSHRSLERHDSIARAPKLIGSARVHHHGIPIKAQTKAGFNRRREVGGVGEDAGPACVIVRTWWKKSDAFGVAKPNCACQLSAVL